MAARETVSLRERQIEERFRSRTLEGEFQSDIQQTSADHRDGEEFRLATPLPHRKSYDDDDRPDTQRDRRPNEGEPTHDDRERWRRQLMDRRACGFIKVSRFALEHLVREPAEENQCRDRRPKAEQQ